MAKKAKKKPAAKKKKKQFRREDIPNISPQLGDMADPFLAAEQRRRKRFGGFSR